MSCNVIIIDDHPLFSRGLSQLIETQRDYKVIGMAKNRNEALTLLDNTKPDLAIVDLNLGQEDGLELIKDIIVIHPQTKILVLSMHDERFYAERAIKAGAKGYIMKEEAESQVINAIKTVTMVKSTLVKMRRQESKSCHRALLLTAAILIPSAHFLTDNFRFSLLLVKDSVL